MTQRNERVKELLGQSVSHATLRDVDLMRAFYNVADFLGLPQPEDAKDLLLMLEYIDNADKPLARFTEHGQEWISYIINEEYFNLFNDVCPDGYYFGTTEGDGADFGFWACDEDYDD